MIKFGYSLSITEAEALKEFKNSSAYGSYLKTISSSPAFKLIMKEHIDKVDVSEDLQMLKNQGKIPENVNAKALSDLFKQSLSKMAVCIAADSVILKELEDVAIDNINDDLTMSSNVEYLLGKADKKFYDQANKLLEQNKLEEDSVAYRGLITYLKLNDKSVLTKKPKKAKTDISVIQSTELDKKTQTKKRPPINIDSNDISL